MMMNKKHFLTTTLLALMFSMSAQAQGKMDSTWYRPPFRLQAGDKLLNTNSFDRGGHAGPFMIDMDGDKRRDLVVGSIDGKFRLYRNTGTDSEPKFSSDSRYLMARDQPAEVPSWCCVASGPQIVDLDHDGIPDLSSGSYAPGALYWFKGLGNATYGERHMLTDHFVMPVLSHSEVVYDDMSLGYTRSYAAQLAWMDWNNDSLPDLIMGNGLGELFVRLQEDPKDDAGNSDMPIKGQPRFHTKGGQERNQKLGEILIDGKKAIPDGHSAPAVADWDGDGLPDILVGSYKGAVYLLKNTGKPGAPEFNTCQQLIGPGNPKIQQLKSGELPERGTRSQVQAIDYNLDGKMDLLVGDWATTRSVRTDLTSKERKQYEIVRKELAALDAEVGYDYTTPRSKSRAYMAFGVVSEDLITARVNKFEALEKKLAPYFESNGSGWDYGFHGVDFYHGTIWVFLAK